MTLTRLLCQFVIVNSLEFKSGAHERKQLRKKSREAVSTAQFPSVCP